MAEFSTTDDNVEPVYEHGRADPVENIVNSRSVRSVQVVPEPGIGDLVAAAEATVTAIAELNSTLHNIYLVLDRIERKIYMPWR